MSYNPVSQADHETTSNASGSDTSESPHLPDTQPFRPLEIDFENLGGSHFRDAAPVTEDKGSVSLKSALKSFGSASASYDMLDDEDYTFADPNRALHNPEGETKFYSESDYHFPNHEETNSTEPEPLIRSPSTRRPPLRHPTPDLQSLQGAYVGNVERLEKSVEHLSLKSDIDKEIRKIEQQQLKRSSSSATYASKRKVGSGPVSPTQSKMSASSMSNSIIGVNSTARASGYSPGGFVASPKGSIRSASSSQAATNRARSGSVASRLAQVIEPENEDQAIPFEHPTVPIIPPPQPPAHTNRQEFSNPPTQGSEPAVCEHVTDERPTTAGSSDTYRQATNLFKDFDGVHFTPHVSEPRRSRAVSLNKPPLARESRSFDQPAPGQNMVFYPAPVPMVLNLPQRLSKRPNPEREKRRTQVLSSLPAEARKSAIWLPNQEEQQQEAAAARRSKRMSNVPPQLRASAFFDPVPAPVNVEVKENSAVATLDSILDASAHAPVSAFTDHPIAGHVGAEVYAREKTSKNKSDKHKRKSTALSGARSQSLSERHAADASDEVDPLRSSSDDGPKHRRSVDSDRTGHRSSEDGSSDEVDEESDSSDEDEDAIIEGETYIGPPTTLLAELQMRKQEQKQRMRSAATAFPNGMHSTLLELDAVAQHQREVRNQRRVALAWEDPDLAERQEPDDEDVPLAVLFPGHQQQDDNRPIGLMEQLELEENEPLSRRRARMRGERLPRNQSPLKLLSVANNLEDGEPEEGEGETLAQRAKRLREEAAAKRSSAFAEELLDQLGANPEPEKTEEPKAEPEEETLGQRRKRLQAEAQGQGQGQSQLQGPKDIKPKQRRSMADILQAHPARHPPVANMAQQANGHQRMQMQHPGMYQQHPGAYGNRMSTMYSQPAAGWGQNFAQPYAGMPGYASNFPNMPYGYGNGMPYSNMPYNQMGMNNSRQSFMPQDPGIDPKQRDMIDRWRQSVL